MLLNFEHIVSCVCKEKSLRLVVFIKLFGISMVALHFQFALQPKILLQSEAVIFTGVMVSTTHCEDSDLYHAHYVPSAMLLRHMIFT